MSMSIQPSDSPQSHSHPDELDRLILAIRQLRLEQDAQTRVEKWEDRQWRRVRAVGRMIRGQYDAECSDYFWDGLDQLGVPVGDSDWLSDLFPPLSWGKPSDERTKQWLCLHAVQIAYLNAGSLAPLLFSVCNRAAPCKTQPAMLEDGSAVCQKHRVPIREPYPLPIILSLQRLSYRGHPRRMRIGRFSSVKRAKETLCLIPGNRLGTSTGYVIEDARNKRRDLIVEEEDFTPSQQSTFIL